GSHNVYNLLAALAAATGMGLSLADLLPAVSRLEAGKRRMERRQFGELTVFDDSYNANPDSARAAVRVLEGLHGSGRRVMVLGDMLELGDDAPELHHQIGCAAARADIDLLLLVGETTRATAAGALECGLSPERVLHLGSPADALERIGALVRAGDIVLVKGSRRMGLDRLVDRLGETFGGGAESR
ncbi:MAG TPA: cyanophycin synthetase, partial [Planctomycetota bacterium]|nr:cyanophycin synthetase [Planctomycetota bacterium]